MRLTAQIPLATIEHGLVEARQDIGRAHGERFPQCGNPLTRRSEEHTSELQSLMRISYAVFCLKKKKQKNHSQRQHNNTQHTKQTEQQHYSRQLQNVYNITPIY